MNSRNNNNVRILISVGFPLAEFIDRPLMRRFLEKNISI
jgi:hypothetical protein